MRWFRKSLLWVSAGYVAAAQVAWAQPVAAPPPGAAGVTLCRPVPVTDAAAPQPAAGPIGLAPLQPLAPAAPAKAPTAMTPAKAPTAKAPAAKMPAFTVRGQMEETRDRSLPGLPSSVPSLVGGPVPGPVADTIRPAALPSPEPARPTAIEAQPKKLEMPLAPDSKPQPESPIPAGPAAASPNSFYLQNNPWTGPTNGVILRDHPALVYENGPGPGDAAGPGQRLWVRAEYLLWWTRGYHLPPLVTTAPATDNEDLRGSFADPNTLVLFGGSSSPSSAMSGGRFMAGWNFDPCGTCGIEGGYFFLGRQNHTFTADSSQFPVLARPFFNVNTGMQDRELTASPGLLPTDAFKLSGTITANNFTSLQGAELNARHQLCCGCDYTVNGFAGFRYLDLHEGLTITENVVSAAAVPGFTIFTPGNRIDVVDSFQTRNRFYGGQLGADGEIRRGPWSLMGRVQVGLGVTHQTIDIAGSQTVTTLAGDRSVFTGGLLALPSNIGQFSRDRFSVVPQVGLKIGYNLNENIRVFVGYDFLYWSSVVRPGDQIDTTVNVTQIPNFIPVGAPPGFIPASSAVRPVVPFRTTGFYAQGVNVGLEVRY
jgi:hypothetical protein